MTNSASLSVKADQAHTFPTKHGAEVWLIRTEAGIISDQWLDPDLGRVVFGEYAQSWVEERPGLRPKTIQLYEGLVRLHMTPALGSLAVGDITDRMCADGAGNCSMLASGRLP